MVFSWYPYPHQKTKTKKHGTTFLGHHMFCTLSKLLFCELLHISCTVHVCVFDIDLSKIPEAEILQIVLQINVARLLRLTLHSSFAASQSLFLPGLHHGGLPNTLHSKWEQQCAPHLAPQCDPDPSQIYCPCSPPSM